MSRDFDFRLFEISSELFALQQQLATIETQICNITEAAHNRLDDIMRDRRTCVEGPEVNEAIEEYVHHTEFMIPRFLRNPYLVSLYAVYESGVTEVATLVQKKKGQQIAMSDIKGAFLERANKYYSNVLGFELTCDSQTFDRIKILSMVRNAIAHANGRIEMLSGHVGKNIASLERRGIGLSVHYGYMVLAESLVQDLSVAVSTALEDLVVRYKRWDDNGGHL